MFGKNIAFIAGCFAAWVLLPAGALAFEQQQAPAASQLPAARSQAAQPDAKGLQLDEKAEHPANEEPQKGVKIPGLGTLTMPKLNFGLDLMYSDDRKDDHNNLGFTNEPLVEEGVTIMGKVKKRF